jgi:hypothetical protein
MVGEPIHAGFQLCTKGAAGNLLLLVLLLIDVMMVVPGNISV